MGFSGTHWMILFKAILALATVVLLGRMIFLLLASEIGRKLDLLKRRYKKHPEFNFAVIVPVTNKQQWQALSGLLAALSQQTYPLDKIHLHLLVPEPLKTKLQTALQSDFSTVFWGFPKHLATQPQALTHLYQWGVERLLAQGGAPKQVIALLPDDIVKPDFIEQMAYKAAFYPVVQSYMALKRKPNNWFALVDALSQRLFNRIDQAGRTHLGLSAKLQHTGWMIHQDVLEKVPLSWAIDSYPEGYRLLLNRAGYSVHWASGVMVYQNALNGLRELLAKQAEVAFMKQGLLVNSLPAVFSLPQAFKQPLAWLDTLWQSVKLPDVVIGFGLFVLWVVALAGNLSIGSFVQFVFLSFLFLSVVSFGVARFSIADSLFYATAAPIAYLTVLVTLPAYLVFGILKQVFEPSVGLLKSTAPSSKAIKLNPVARGEEQESILTIGIPDFIEELEQAVEDNDQVKALKSAPLPSHFKQPHEIVISNGVQRITCEVTLSAQQEKGQYRYQLILHYKGATFETQYYPLVDQAFYELQAKLQERGFYVFSCGSCAYFYHPVQASFQLEQESDSGVEADGYCLQAKQGQPLEQNINRVHILSPHCHHHRDHAFRDDILRQWKYSLGQATRV